MQCLESMHLFSWLGRLQLGPLWMLWTSCSLPRTFFLDFDSLSDGGDFHVHPLGEFSSQPTKLGEFLPQTPDRDGNFQVSHFFVILLAGLGSFLWFAQMIGGGFNTWFSHPTSPPAGSWKSSFSKLHPCSTSLSLPFFGFQDSTGCSRMSPFGRLGSKVGIRWVISPTY